MLKSLLALLVFATPAFGETLLSGSIYFDSENTFLEVQDFIHANDQDGLVRLFKGNHISAKLPTNLDIIVLRSGLDAESPAEFRFPNNPTTYWTYSKYVTAGVAKGAVSPSPSPGPNLTPPANFPFNLTATATPTPLPRPSPTPTSTPVFTPTPKSGTQEDNSEETPAPLRRHHRRGKESLASSGEEGVPESAKVWHQVNGHWKWYDKRNLHEVRKALPLSSTVSSAEASPNPTPVPPVKPPQ